MEDSDAGTGAAKFAVIVTLKQCYCLIKRRHTDEATQHDTLKFSSISTTTSFIVYNITIASFLLQLNWINDYNIVDNIPARRRLVY